MNLLFVVIHHQHPHPYLHPYFHSRHFIKILLNLFPSDGTSLSSLFNLLSDMLQFFFLLTLFPSFDLSFNNCSSTHKGGNILETLMPSLPCHINSIDYCAPLPLASVYLSFFPSFQHPDISAFYYSIQAVVLSPFHFLHPLTSSALDLPAQENLLSLLLGCQTCYTATGEKCS